MATRARSPFFHIALLAVTIVSTCWNVDGLKTGLVNTRMTRDLNLTGQVTMSVITILVRNAGVKPAGTYLLALPDPLPRGTLSFLKVEVGAAESDSTFNALTALDIKPLSSIPGSPPNVTFFEVTLGSPLEPGSTTNLRAQMVFTKAMDPFPTEILQSEAQRMLYEDSHWVLSPYLTETQTTRVYFPSSLIESYTREGRTVRGASDDELEYGPYPQVEPYAVSPMRLHFENNMPFVSATKLVREILISHWGNVAVKEHYQLAHVGARHKGRFSRYDFQRNPSANGIASLNMLTAHLPVSARSVYYVDQIGNISTSHVRKEMEHTRVELQPRFPLFGGWKIDFILGYGLPLAETVFRPPSGGGFVLNTTFGSPIAGLVVEAMEVRVVLPEGAHSIQAHTPFPVVQTSDKKVSYLDTSHRPVVVLTMTNAVAEHNQYFTVTYRTGTLGAMRKPMLLVFSFFAIFLGYMVFIRLDLSISRSATWQETQDREWQRHCMQRFGAVISTRESGLRSLAKACETLQASRNLNDFLPIKAKVDGLMKDCSEKASAILKDLEIAGFKDFLKLKELERKEQERKVQLFQIVVATTDCVRRDLSVAEMGAKLARLETGLSSVAQELKELRSALDFS